MKKFKDNSFIEISMTVLQKCKKSLQYYEVSGAQAAGNSTYFMCDNAHLYFAGIYCFFKL